MQLRVKVFGFFVHSKPPKLADKMKNLPRWALTILVIADRGLGLCAVSRARQRGKFGI